MKPDQPVKRIAGAPPCHRLFIAAFLLLLLLPGLVHLAGGSRDASVENRALAELPAPALTQKALASLPANVDAYLNDHFGLRNGMIRLNNRLRHALFGELDAVQLTAGKDGFVFFNSHAAAAPMSMIHFLCGRDVSPVARTDLAARLAGFLQTAVQAFPDSHLFLAPTKPVVYGDKLPDWLQAECAASTPTVPAVIELLAGQPGARERVIYPFADMLALKQEVLLYPRRNFHWDGEGARRIAELVAEKYLHRSRLRSLAGTPVVKSSDLQHFVPGVRMDIEGSLPDFAGAGIAACDGAACFPEFGDAAARIGDLSRFTQIGRKGPRLLIISDSFGHGIAPYFAQYFADVRHLSTNTLGLLTQVELARVKQILFETDRPDEILYIYHDFSLPYFEGNALRLIGGGKS